MKSTHPISPDSGIDHDRTTETYRTTHDWTGTVPLSTTVLGLVSAAADADPTDLSPLNGSVDPDALDSLFAPREDGSPRTPGSVSFYFEGYEVFVHADGEVTLRER